MIETIINFTKSPVGEILIRVTCILFIGAMGLKMFIKKIGDIFELYTRSMRTKKMLDLVADVLSIVGTVVISILISHVYSHISKENMSELYINAEGILYGFGAVGLNWLFSDGRFMKFIRAWKGRNGKK